MDILIVILVAVITVIYALYAVGVFVSFFLASGGLVIILLTPIFYSLSLFRTYSIRRRRVRIYRRKIDIILKFQVLTNILKGINMNNYSVMVPFIPENSIIYYKPIRNRKSNLRKKDFVCIGDYILYNIPVDIYYKKYNTFKDSNLHYLIGKVHNISREGIEVLLEKKSTGFDIDSTDFGFLNPIYVKGIITDILLKDHEELNSTDLCHT